MDFGFREAGSMQRIPRPRLLSNCPIFAWKPFRRAGFEITNPVRAGGFNPANRITWDGELLVDMALAGARFASVSKVLGDFRIYAESITGSNKHRELARGEHERIAEKIRSHGIPLYSSPKKQLQRALYKANLVRHLRYLRAR